jgi:phosphoglycerate dehydrogenase-like enzyme
VDHFYTPEERREMIALSENIVATAPLTEETKHMISDVEFAVMKPTAVVINVGRGSVIDEPALLRALTAKRIKGAGSDVFEHEPLGGTCAVKARMSCCRRAARTTRPTGRFRRCASFLEQHGRFEKGEPLKNIVNKRLGY